MCEVITTKKLICTCCGAEVEEKNSVILDGEVYCEECVTVCDCCGEVVLKEYTTYTGDGDVVCEACLDNEYCYCEHCEEYHRSDEMYEVYTRRCTECWCEYCAENHAFKCADCGNYYSEDYYDKYTINGDDYCSDCACERFYYCEGCGEYFESDDIVEYNGCCYCRDCAESRGYNDLIKSYHFHKYDFEALYSNKIRINTKKHLIGFELEIDDGESKSDCAEELNNYFNRNNDVIYFEEDGSLSDGFEIISQPLHIDFIRNDFDFKALEEICVNNGFKSHNTSTCGLHLHFNRAMFGSNEKIQNNTIAKIITFYNIFYNDMLKASRRKSEEASRWAGCYYNNNGDIEKKVTSNMLKEKNGRYYAVNNSNRKTVEFRIGRGTLKASTIKCWIELHYRLVLNAKKIKWSEINDIKKWLYKMPVEVIEYLKSRNAFLGVFE